MDTPVRLHTCYIRNWIESTLEWGLTINKSLLLYFQMVSIVWFGCLRSYQYTLQVLIKCKSPTICSRNPPRVLVIYRFRFLLSRMRIVWSACFDYRQMRENLFSFSNVVNRLIWIFGFVLIIGIVTSVYKVLQVQQFIVGIRLVVLVICRIRVILECVSCKVLVSNKYTGFKFWIFWFLPKLKVRVSNK